jgi:hypothetical protein
LRLQRESVIGGLPRDGSGEHFNRYIAPNMFAGSILNLDPDTEYEARFVLSDPDGVKGKKEQIVTVRTRKEPTPAAGGAVYHVYPFDYKGPKVQPCLHGAAGRLLPGLRPVGSLTGDAAQGSARRHDPGARRGLQGQPFRL